MNGSLLGYVNTSDYTQNYETTVPNHTSNTGFSWKPTTAGTYTFTSSVNVNTTICNLTPSSFAGTPFTVHAMACKPDFTEVNPPDNDLLHLQPTTIEIYTAISSQTLANAIDDVAESYSNILTDVSFNRTTSDCGTGATCIHIVEQNIPGYCSQSSADYDANGDILEDIVITLDDGWSTNGAIPLTRALSHELGHLLDLKDQAPCDPNDSVMRSGIQCDDDDLDPFPTINNYLPINNTVYNSGPRTSRGF